jgi:2-aminoadipate transaminase
MEEITFLRGVPAEEALLELKKYINKYWCAAIDKYGIDVLQYSGKRADFNGFIPLKETLAGRFSVSGNPNHRVICSNGGMEILSFLFKALPKGSVIAMEATTYDRTLSDALRCGLQVIGVPLGSDGIDLDSLQTVLRSTKIHLFYSIIYHQNPTGICYTSQNIQAAAKLCRKYGVLFVCDIAYYELRYDGKTNQAIDLSEVHNVDTCLLGSFTKTISPGTKCGFGIFPPNVVETLTPVIANTRLNPNYPTQAMVSEMIRDGFYDNYLKFLIGLYTPKMLALNEAMGRYFPELHMPEITGGFFCLMWLERIAPSKEEDFIRKVNESGVLIAPAHGVITPDSRGILRNNGLPVRLTFPSLSIEDIEKGISIIAQVYKNTDWK